MVVQFVVVFWVQRRDWILLYVFGGCLYVFHQFIDWRCVFSLRL